MKHLLRKRPIVTVTILGGLLITSCGGDDAATESAAASAAAPATTEPPTTTAAPATTLPPATTQPPTTTPAPATTQPPATTEAPTEPHDGDSVPQITREDAEALHDAIAAAASSGDPTAFRAAVGEAGAFVELSGVRYSGEGLEALLAAEWATGVVYENETDLVATPAGFANVRDAVLPSGASMKLGLEFRRNADGDFDVVQFDTVIRDVLAAAPSDPMLDEAEAREVLEQVVGTYSNDEWAGAADALGPDGVFVEIGRLVPAAEVPAFLASFTAIERIDITGPGVPAFGGYGFPIEERHVDSSVAEYVVLVTTDAEGALRTVWLYPGQFESLADSTSGSDG